MGPKTAARHLASVLRMIDMSLFDTNPHRRYVTISLTRKQAEALQEAHRRIETVEAKPDA